MSFNLKLLVVVLSVLLLAACGPMYQDNKYGNGHYMSQEERDALADAQGDPYFDYQAYQYNFVSLSVNQVSYNLTQSLSHMIIKGTCFNPGFQTTSIYYTVYDSQGISVASDGLPYATNMSYYPGTANVKPVSLVCGANGLWATAIAIPTAMLYKLSQGYVQFSMVVWHKGQALSNESTGMTSVNINPPPLATDDSTSI